MTKTAKPAPKSVKRITHKSKAMTPLVVRVPSALLALVRRDAKANGVDVSTQVRNVLVSYTAKK